MRSILLGGVLVALLLGLPRGRPEGERGALRAAVARVRADLEARAAVLRTTGPTPSPYATTDEGFSDEAGALLQFEDLPMFYENRRGAAAGAYASSPLALEELGPPERPTAGGPWWVKVDEGVYLYSLTARRGARTLQDETSQRDAVVGGALASVVAGLFMLRRGPARRSAGVPASPGLRTLHSVVFLVVVVLGGARAALPWAGGGAVEPIGRFQDAAARLDAAALLDAFRSTGVITQRTWSKVREAAGLEEGLDAR